MSSPTQKPLALVTGASAGLGALFARKLAARGYRPILVARRRDRLEQLAQQLEGEVLTADLAEEADLAAVEARIRGEENLDFLVNNAGFGTKGLFFESDLEPQYRMHRLHVRATMRLTHAALTGMVRRNRGAVINVSSVAGFAASPGNASYCATKAWMTAFTASLDLELRSIRSAVKVQALCPGFTYSEFHDVMGMDRASIPGPLWMDPDFVVEESLRALDRGGDPVVIPSFRYKAISAFLRHFPRRLLRGASIRYARRSGRV